MGQFSFVSFGLLVVVISLSGVKGCCCPDGWLPMNEFCYKVTDEAKTWKDAEVSCRMLKPGCNLASIHSEEESGDLAQYISDYITKGGNVWIGLTDAQKVNVASLPLQDRVWDWTDRSSTDYLAWAAGEPNNLKGNEYCVEILASTDYMKWNDHPCDFERASLCQCSK
ncbi:C-type lectin lectoxin-Thr1-like [Erythrolamprus reginae]|uniref:C-type lectin lectoxin-Thr1-like n=1 Tax=Erythrolamprus reginae TaxID=121349 RepID=UPI00396C4A73